jgi:hypothetical protein
MPNTSGARDDERQLCRRAGYRRRHRASDQERGTSAQQLLDVVASALQTRSEEEVELFLDGMNNMVSGTATYQESGSTVRLPIGRGVARLTSSRSNAPVAPLPRASRSAPRRRPPAARPRRAPWG